MPYAKPKRGTSKHLTGNLMLFSITLFCLAKLLVSSCSDRKTHLVDAHMEVNGAIFEHNKRNPGVDYHFDVKHTLRKNIYLD